MAKSLFDMAGGVVSRNLGGTGGADYCYMSLSGGPLERAVMGRAPMTGVSMSADVDLQVSKALDGDLIVASFGFRPVSISIEGVDLFASGCSLSGDTIAGVFEKLNVDSNPKVRVDLVLRAGGPKYRCIVTGIRFSNNSKTAGQQGGYLGAGQYVLNMIGVRKTSRKR